MNSRFSIMLIIALLAAGSAAWMAKKWVDAQSLQSVSEVNSVPVVVAAVKIPFATRVEANHVKVINWPKDAAPDDTFTDASLVIGKIAQREFFPNELVLKPQIADHAGGSVLSALIQPGMRAMSVRVDDVAGVAGFILPGNRADILKTDNQSKRTTTLLKNMKILAIDQTASPEQDKPAVVRSLTLEVSPKQAEILFNAMKSSTLMFTLRSPSDTDNGPIEEAEAAAPVPQKAAPIAPPTRTVSITILPWLKDEPHKIESKDEESLQAQPKGAQQI